MTAVCSSRRKRIVAWINVCGPLNGSRMADWVLANRLRTLFFRTQFWLQRRDFNFITDLRHDSNAPLDFEFNMPATLKIVNIVGFPFQRHMTTPFSRFCHRTLSAYGPNDGTISLSDVLSWPGEIYPTWGMDHYFRPQNEAANLVAAVLQFVAESFSQNVNDAIDFVPGLASNIENKSLV